MTAESAGPSDSKREGSAAPESYEPPTVEDVDTTHGPGETAAGITPVFS